MAYLQNQTPPQQPAPLPPGFRFYPTEEELVSFYLANRLHGTRTPEIERFIPVVDVYRYEPSQLPQMSGECNVHDPEQWFFFCPRQEREAQGGRPTRITPSGYWKATGSTSYVYSSSAALAATTGDGHGKKRRAPAHGPIAIKKTMVFYMGRAPHGTRTLWKMNEYKAIDVEAASSASNTGTLAVPPKPQHDFTVCRVYVKSNSLRSFDRRPPGVDSSSADVRVPSSVDGRGSRNNWQRGAAEPVAEMPMPATSSDVSSENNDDRGWPGGDQVNMRILEDINNWDYLLEPF